MELIREQLMYKGNAFHVCLNTLTRQEQYDFLRLVMATRKDGLTICYDNSNVYIKCLIEKIGLDYSRCPTSGI